MRTARRVVLIIPFTTIQQVFNSFSVFVLASDKNIIVVILDIFIIDVL
ncbi:MAG: hypothetical protein JETT_3860 [Candidatus Jettenia ecosi]|uniref:Uncharacterized protein n=1 Tax=Candidatus Jettenia ecosi TaxID=2494326 RepID=A0A533Q5Q8_9BACT|nr:MAG: hypothetical protein JETT_3860 [Candidatus Jettenia ecosi]